MSLSLRKLLMRHEGVRLLVYDDATGRPLNPGDTLQGHPTIGVGRALDTNGISQLLAEQMLAEDVENVLRQCRRHFPWFDDLNQTRQDVVASMVFNLGLAGFKRFAKVIGAIEAEEFGRAATEMLDSKWARQVGARAHELAAMMREGCTPGGA